MPITYIGIFQGVGVVGWCAIGMHGMKVGKKEEDGRDEGWRMGERGVVRIMSSSCFKVNVLLTCHETKMICNDFLVVCCNGS